jgi:hypothetical protein
MGVTTAPTPEMMRLAREWEDIYPSAVFSGINGDAPHGTRPSKHHSRSYNRDKFGANAWPITSTKDKQGPSDKACAVDMSMAKADMVKCTGRMRTVFNNRKLDPRATYFGAFNGWDGSGDAVRYNFLSGVAEYATDDHKWHCHDESFYAYVNSATMVDAQLSALRGQTIAQYTGKDDLVTTQAEFNALLLAALKSPNIAMTMRALPWQYNGGGVADNDSTTEGNISTLKVLDTVYKGIALLLRSNVDVDEVALAAALAPAVSAAVIAALPDDKDDVTVEELTEAFRRAVAGPAS